MFDDKIELLSEKLIDLHLDVAIEVLAMSSRLSIPLGWHYLLDIIWVLVNIREYRNSLDKDEELTVLEVGAGHGLLQFILASSDYQVISVDIAQRDMPDNLKNLYQFNFMNDSKNLTNEYLKHHNMLPKSFYQRVFLKLINLSPKSFVMGISRRLGNNPRRLEQLSENTVKKPVIKIYQADARDMSLLPDSQIDFGVSISALEHNDPKLANGIQQELLRVIKKGGQILHTISATRHGCGFHEPSHSFLLDEEGLAKTYLLKEYKSNFSQWGDIEKFLAEPKYLSRWLSSMYYNSGKNGMPWGVWDPGYLPVGVKKVLI